MPPGKGLPHIVEASAGKQRRPSTEVLVGRFDNLAALARSSRNSPFEYEIFKLAQFKQHHIPTTYEDMPLHGSKLRSRLYRSSFHRPSCSPLVRVSRPGTLQLPTWTDRPHICSGVKTLSRLEVGRNLPYVLTPLFIWQFVKWACFLQTVHRFPHPSPVRYS